MTNGPPNDEWYTLWLSEVVSLLVQYTGPDSGRRGRAGDQLHHCHCQCLCVAIIILRQLPLVSSLTCDNLHWISVSSKVLITHDPHHHHDHPHHHHDHDVQEPRTTTTIATATQTAQKHQQRSDKFSLPLSKQFVKKNAGIHDFSANKNPATCFRGCSQAKTPQKYA